MANPDAIKGQGFHTNPERINRKGRPRKMTIQLKEQGYKLAEINDTLMVLLSMTSDELESVWKNKDSTVLEKAVANAIYTSIRKGSLWNIESILTRALGKPKEQTEHSGTQTIKVVYERSTDNIIPIPQRSNEDIPEAEEVQCIELRTEVGKEHTSGEHTD